MLEKLQPQNVFYFFEEMTKIPHGSGNEKAISDYLVNFAKERGLEVIQDDILNVIIKAPGTDVIWIWCVKRQKIAPMIL